MSTSFSPTPSTTQPIEKKTAHSLISLNKKYISRSFFLPPSFSVYAKKLRPQNKSPLKICLKEASTGALGGFLAVLLLDFLSIKTGVAWMMAPFGASCVLAFGVWDSPLSQPRNIIGGYFIATLAGLTASHIFGPILLASPLAVGVAIGLMMLTKTTHPPAGAVPFIIVLTNAPWTFIFSPVLLGSTLIVLLALLINNVRKSRSYPTFWV